MRWIRKILGRLTDKDVADIYKKHAGIIGNVVSYSYMGEPAGMPVMVKNWAEAEKKYAERGYRTISLDRWIDHGGYGFPLDDVWMIKREEGEAPIYHAEIYKEKYLGKVKPAIDFDEMFRTGKPQIGNYCNPTTESEDDE